MQASSPGTSDAVRIVEAADVRDYAAAVTLQRSVWGAGAPIVPAPQLVAAAHTGGVVLVAYEGDRPVGFCYGFVGLDEHPPATVDAVAGATAEVILWSHMLAVLPSHRGRGLGTRLKLAQADIARARGMRRMLWTFDPLESGNAWLNLRRLGAIAARYSVDRYGPMADDLNAGLETDRLIADWWIAREGTNRPAAPDNEELLVNPDAPDGDVHPAEDIAAHDGPVVVTAPGGEWRTDRERARRWRHNVRRAFLTAMSEGFVAVDVRFDQPVACYRLVRATAGPT